MKVNEQTLKTINRFLSAAKVSNMTLVAVVDPDEKESISIMDERGNFGYGVTPFQATVDSILGPRVVTKYEVTKLKVFPGAYWESPDQDYVNIGEFRSLADVATTICVDLATEHIRNAVEAVGWALQNEEEEREANVS